MGKLIREMLLPTILILVATVVTAWLFFDFSPVAAGLLVYVPAALVRRRKEQKRKQKWELNLAFKDALICLENGLAVGYSPESSVKEGVKSLEQLYGREHEICREFRRMSKQMELGTSIEQCFLEFGRRSDIEDVKQLSDIFSMVKRTGGNLSQVLRQTGHILQEKIELKRELHTAIAAKQMEFQIMCIVPYGILAYLRIAAPAMCEGLYHTGFGYLFMYFMLIAYYGLRCLGEYIIRSEIGKLEG